MAKSRRRVGIRNMFVLVAATLATTACAPLAAGDWGDILLGGLGSSVTGEVRSVDTRRSSISVREDRGSTRSYRYDSRTRVYDSGREYRVSSLQRGDRVRVQVEQDRNGTAWANRIDVQDARRTTTGTGSGRVQRVSGTVQRVDTRRGYFTVEQNRSSDIVVYVPPRVSRDDERRFERLRRGNRVSAEVREVRRGQYELVRFR